MKGGFWALEKPSFRIFYLSKSTRLFKILPKCLVSLFLLSINLIPLNFFAQATNLEYEKIQVGDVQNHLVWLALSPDQKTVAISSTQSYPFYIYDFQNRKLVKTFDIGEWYAGARIRYSRTGKYLLFQQLYYMDYAPNKDREVNFEIIDANTGAEVINFSNYHSVDISPNEKYAVTHSGDDVAYWNLMTKDKEKSFNVKDATNSVAISRDGKLVAVSHLPWKEDLKKNPMYLNNKKNQSILEKYKQQITVYDAATFQPKYTINDFYDIVYDLNYSDDGNYLFIYSVPHTKIQGPSGRTGYVSVANAMTGEPMRNAFGSISLYDVDYKLSPNGRLFGIVSNGKFPEVHIYDFMSNDMLARFELSFKMFQKSDDGSKLPTDLRASFTFLPDNRHVLITFGNRLLLWDTGL